MPYAISLSFDSHLARHRHELWCAHADVPLPAVPAWETRLLARVPRSTLDEGLARAASGRFYPARVLGGFDAPAALFRIVAVEGDGLVVDFNHPLAGRPASLDVQQAEGPGALALPPARVLEWAGLEAPMARRETDFGDDDAFDRADEATDADFYRAARRVLHLDAVCARRVRALYHELLAEGAEVLDLMCGWRSHLPAHVGRVTGLGMNREEMADNPALAACTVHDLNEDPALPFAERAFDGVVNTVSIEYLVEPERVLREVRRVLRPGGVLAVIFSNRYFAPKAIALWQRLHPAERLGWVLQILHRAGFEQLHTAVERGLARDPGDRHAAELEEMDPLLAVWGYRPH